MANLERWATYTVVVHTAILVIHAGAHGVLQIAVPSALDAAFIAVAMFISPVAAVVILQRRPAVARPLFFLSMLASFSYGAISHYILAGQDHVASVAAEGWGLVFQGTTAMLAVVEMIGILIGALLLRPTRSAS